MHSPKFTQKATEFRRLVNATVLAKLWSKSNGVRAHMRKQLVPDVVEFLDFHIQHRQRCKALEALICAGDYLPSPILRMRVEKGKGLCRQVALPAPSDALVLQALSNSLWREIEKKSPCPTAFFAPQDQPFSKRNPENEEDEFGYGPIESWLDFQEEVLKFSKKHAYVVVTDIANYYDGILHSFLRAILSDYGLEREHALDLLLFILDAMLWRPDYMPNYGIGLPQMNLDTPRLLAHTHLFEIDELFENTPNVDFARYMDDMDFGVDTLAEAKLVLRDLDLALHTRNIRLNSGKTKILTADEALHHFRVADNNLTQQIIERIDTNGHLPRRKKIYGKVVSRAIANGLRQKRFTDGNGGKILKRLLGVSFRNSFSVDDKSFRDVLYNWPALREYLLKTWQRSDNYIDQYPLIIGFLGSGQAIDDYFRVALADTISSSVHSTNLSYKTVYELTYQLRGEDPFTHFATLWILSRVETKSRLFDHIKKTQEVWSRHAFLSRLVAGFYGVFMFTPHFSEFERIVRRNVGVDGLSVFEFHKQLSTDSTAFNSVKSFLVAGSPSLPTGLSHAKVLMLATALWNSSVPKLERAKLLGKQITAMRDVYYRNLLSDIISNAI